MAVKWIQSLALGVVSTGLAFLLWHSGALTNYENTTWDIRVRNLAGPGKASEEIKFIFLDQASLDWGEEIMGLSWPWPREVYSAIIGFCRDAGAKAIVFDVVFTESSRAGVYDDEVLGSAIRATPQFVNAFTLGEEEGSSTTWPVHIQAPVLRYSNLEHGLKTFMTLPRASFPVDAVATNVQWLGNAFSRQDEDSIFRRASLFQIFDEKAVPSLGLAGYLAGSNLPEAGTVPVAVSPNRFTINQIKIPVNHRGESILNYRNYPDAYDRVRAAAVVRSFQQIQEGKKPELDPAIFKDRYVLFGFSAPALLDLRPTPVHPQSPGVLVHATVLDNLLSNDFIALTPSWIFWTLTFLIASMGSAFVIISKKVWQSVVAFGVLFPVPVLLGCWWYTQNQWWPIVPQELGIALALIGGVLVSYATEGRQKAFIKSAFKHYLSPAVIDQILDDPSQLQLGGERREMTILFSDLEAFSAISESLDPQDLTRLLNDYLTDMTDIILEEGGTLDKYEGDAILAFWNAPLQLHDHPERAARAAIRCMNRLEDRSIEFTSRAGRPLRMRVGINTGDVVVGNMGSRDRFDYTVLGDAANLASRLEGANKAFGTSCMISEDTWNRVSDNLEGRFIASIRVVGRREPVRVYELLGLGGSPEPSFLSPFLKGIAYCEEGNWMEAIKAFEQAEHDPVSQRYLKRCRQILLDPGKGWDGIWNLTEK